MAPESTTKSTSANRLASTRFTTRTRTSVIPMRHTPRGSRRRVGRSVTSQSLDPEYSARNGIDVRPAVHAVRPKAQSRYRHRRYGPKGARAAIPMIDRGLSGPRLVVAAAAGVMTLVAAILATPHPGESELRVTLRVTALVSATFFLSAFTASAWQRLRPTPTTRWLLRNRRYLGLSFAASHLAHGLAILALARRIPGGWRAFPPPTLAGGGAAYVFIAAMAATAHDRGVRALVHLHVHLRRECRGVAVPCAADGGLRRGARPAARGALQRQAVGRPERAPPSLGCAADRARLCVAGESPGRYA